MTTLKTLYVDVVLPLQVLQQSLKRKLGPEYNTVRLQVSEHYSHKYKESLLHHRQELAGEDEIGELSLRPSVFQVLEEVLKVSETTFPT